MILKIINKYITGFAAQVLLISILFYTGCSSSNIETVDSNTLQKDHNDISRIYSFELKDGRSFNDEKNNIYLNIANSSLPQIIFNGPATDSLGKNIPGSLFQGFSLFDVIHAEVQYKKKNNPLPVILSITAAIGVVVFIFWANGQRNKRTTN